LVETEEDSLVVGFLVISKVKGGNNMMKDTQVSKMKDKFDELRKEIKKHTAEAIRDAHKNEAKLLGGLAVEQEIELDSYEDKAMTDEEFKEFMSKKERIHSNISKALKELRRKI
jgi:cellobiose-specific phosphotransferase system component IIA